LRRYAFVAWTAARQEWTYRAEVAMRAVQMVLFMSIFVALWVAAFAAGGQSSMAGYSLADIVWYLAMTETITLSSSRVFMQISEAVRAGDIAYTLTRPMNYPLAQVAESLGNSGPRFLLNLLTGCLVAAIGSGQLAGSPSGAAAFLVLGASALVMDALVGVLIGLLAFWIEEVTPAFWIYQKLLFTVGGLFLPIELFPAALRRLAQWLPFHYIAYAPARAFVAFDFSFALSALGGQLIYIVALLALVFIIWGRARRRLTVHGG
jgi:ABC-2 type transport system permease protein